MENINVNTATDHDKLIDIVGDMLARDENAQSAQASAETQALVLFDAVKAEGINYAAHKTAPKADASPEHKADYFALRRVAACALADRLNVSRDEFIAFTYGDGPSRGEKKAFGHSKKWKPRHKAGWQSAVSDIWTNSERHYIRSVQAEIKAVAHDVKLTEAEAEKAAKAHEEVETAVDKHAVALEKCEAKLAAAEAKAKKDPGNAKARMDVVKLTDQKAKMIEKGNTLRTDLEVAKALDVGMVEHVAALQANLSEREEMLKAVRPKAKTGARRGKSLADREADHLRKLIDTLKEGGPQPFDVVDALEAARALLKVITTKVNEPSVH